MSTITPLLFIALFLGNFFIHTTQAQLRPMVPDDLYRLQHFGDEFVFSPSGEFLAYVVQRPLGTAAHQKRDFLERNDIADIWIVRSSKGRPQKLTDGEKDQTGFWHPRWSPDGNHLAMLSTRGGNVNLWVWSKRTKKLRQLTQEGLDLSYDSSSFHWITDDQILCVLPENPRQPLKMTVETQAEEKAISIWPESWTGKKTTASVLKSGIPISSTVSSADIPKKQLTIVSLFKKAIPLFRSPEFIKVEVSPNSKFSAVLFQTGQKITNSAVLSVPTLTPASYQLAVIDHFRQRLSPPFLGPVDIEPESMSWSLNSEEISVVGKLKDSEDESPIVFKCEVKTLVCKPILSKSTARFEWSGQPLLWSPKNELLTLTGSFNQGEQASERKDWWRISTALSPINLTAKLDDVPSQLMAYVVDEWISLANHRLWKYNFSTSEPSQLCKNSDLNVTTILWPNAQKVSQLNHNNKIVVAAETNEKKAVYQIDLKSCDETLLASEIPSGFEFRAYSPMEKTAFYSTKTREGSVLWRSHENGILEPVVKLNQFLKEVNEGQLVTIHYRSLDQKELKSWLILPIDYKVGLKYPLIVELYPGRVYREGQAQYHSINNSSSLNLQLFAAHGYAVLIPSMPLQPEGIASDPFTDLPIGVLPAIDQVIEMGIADPNKIGVMGQSYGGYGTYGLISQTHRFKAAVSLAGISNLTSYYGTLDPRFRYEDRPQEFLFAARLSEAGQLRMGSPPWKDRERYIRNSPISYVDQVQTPLMMIQGDMDYVSIQQGEEYFIALHRQSKRAEFVRYWGEGHVIRGQANVNDMWNRMYDWFDHFFGPSETNQNH